MLLLFLLFLCAFLLCLALTPLVRALSLKFGFGLDQPDSPRKLHKRPIPRVGGIPLACAYSGSVALLLFMAGSLSQVHHFVWRLVLAAVLVFVVGLLDDLVGLKPWQKLTGEALAGVLAYLGGIQIQNLGDHPVPYFLALPLTVIWLVGCTNAFNLIDGLDGLAAGIGFLAAIASMFAGILHGNTGLVAATAPLAGALLALLVFNFNPASVFLGDGGSLWTGFMLACVGVIWSNKSVAVLSVVAPLMAFSLPLLDTVLSISRRFLRGQPIFQADREHIHHRLLDRGLSPRKAVLLLYAVSAIGAGFSLLQTNSRLSIRGLGVAAFCTAVWIGVHYLGYQEFGFVASVLRLSKLRSHIRLNICLSAHESALNAASSLEECWSCLSHLCHELDVTQVDFHVDGHTYSEKLSNLNNGTWILYFPMFETESEPVYVRLVCTHGSAAHGSIVPQLADMLRRSFEPKVCQFRKAVRTGPELSPVTTPIREKALSVYS